MDIQDKIIEKLTEMSSDMKDMKVDISETKTDVRELRGHVEGFVRLHETLDCEVVTLRSKLDRFKDRLKMVEAR
jgi:hypothetical protein